jgi:glutamine synthetase
MVDFIDPVTHAPLSVCPRSLLKRVKGEFERVQVQPMVGIEYEFFCFKETPESLVEKKHVGLTPLTPGMFGYSLLRPTLNQTYFYALFNECAKFGIPVEGLHTETGPGVLEAALEYGDALTLCDRAQLFKLAAKQLGAPHGITASFMAKPHNNLPGCGGHVHFSLRDTRTGENLFYDADAVDDAVDGGASTAGMSTVLKQFLAGVLQGLPSMLPIFAPTVNSYKRLVENYWAPTVVTWGRENRTAALRVIMPPACSPSSARIEMRVPGADANATLAVTAVLACGLYGIRTKLELPRGAAGDATQDRSFERLGGDLWTATNAMAAKDSLARQVLGDEFVNHYVATRRHEWREWTMAVTDWEVKRYLETV